MTTLTIRLPDDTAARIKALARERGLSVNKRIEELSIQVLAVRDTENRFRAMLGARGSCEHQSSLRLRHFTAEISRGFDPLVDDGAHVSQGVLVRLAIGGTTGQFWHLRDYCPIFIAPVKNDFVPQFTRCHHRLPPVGIGESPHESASPDTVWLSLAWAGD